MNRHADVSFWLETAGDLTPRPALDGSADCDVAVVGAGYTGLWAAYQLQELDPSLRILIVEQEIAGFGASGRNGGWCSSDTGASLRLLQRRFGRDRAGAVQRAMYQAVDDVGRIAEREGIDAEFRKGGMLLVARGDGQVAGVEAAYRDYVRAGFAGQYELLDARQLRDHMRVRAGRAALYTPECAVVHPGRLVRGLATAVERRGARIVEQTAVAGWHSGSRPRLMTQRGTVRTSVVVLATEAYGSQMRALHRAVLPVYSLIVLTEPVSDQQWADIGWERHECVASMRLTVDYLSRTSDGRILVGGRGAPYAFASSMHDRMARHERTHAMLRTMLSDWFPSLGGVRFTHAWGGAVGIPRDFIPSIYHQPADGVAGAHGYTGHGVAFARLAGAALAELITNRRTTLSDLPFVGHRSPNWEPEPLRWLGVRAVQAGLARVDARRSQGRLRRTTLVERLTSH